MFKLPQSGVVDFAKLQKIFPHRRASAAVIGGLC